MVKREQMSRVLNPMPDIINDEQDLSDYYVTFFQDIVIMLRQLEHRLTTEEDAIPIDFQNQLQFLHICAIKRLVNINAIVQKYTKKVLKKSWLFSEVINAY